MASLSSNGKDLDNSKNEKTFLSLWSSAEVLDVSFVVKIYMFFFLVFGFYVAWQRGKVNAELDKNAEIEIDKSMLGSRISLFNLGSAKADNFKTRNYIRTNFPLYYYSRRALDVLFFIFFLGLVGLALPLLAK